MMEDVKKTQKQPHRPMSGGTLEGQRPTRYQYWRVGDGEQGKLPLEFWVARAGEYHGKPGYFYRANSWEQENWIQAYYFIEGKATFVVAGLEQKIIPGDVLILPPNITIEGRGEGEIKFHWFAVEGKWPPALGAKPAAQHFSVGLDEVLLELFSALREALILKRTGSALRALGIFYNIIARIEELVQRQAKLPVEQRSQYPESVRNAIIYLEEHYLDNFNAAKTAAEAGVSASHLRALFEKWLGESPKHFHTRCRIQEAKRLLREQNLSVSEVALQIGFTDRGHFSRVFRQCVGISPREYSALGQDRITLP